MSLTQKFITWQPSCQNSSPAPGAVVPAQVDCCGQLDGSGPSEHRPGSLASIDRLGPVCLESVRVCSQGNSSTFCEHLAVSVILSIELESGHV